MFFVLSRACLISIYKHYAIDISDPSSMQDTCHMNFVIGLAHRGVSVAQWQNIGVRNPKVRGSIPRGTQNFSLIPRSRKDEKNFLYFFTELKIYHLSYFYLQTSNFNANMQNIRRMFYSSGRKESRTQICAFKSCICPQENTTKVPKSLISGKIKWKKIEINILPSFFF